MANNNIQRYNQNQEFSVEKVYQKLTQGIEKLSPDEAVDGLLTGADYLRKMPKLRKTCMNCII